MSEVAEVVADQPSGPPEDFAEYEVWYAAGGGSAGGEDEVVAPAVGDKEPPSVPLEEETTQEGQTAAESDTGEETQQETAETQVETPPRKGNSKLERRLRELTGEIKGLKSQLAERDAPDVADEVTAEVVSAPEATADDTKLVRPSLSAFEDTDTQTAWEQYEAALDAYNDAKSEQKIAKALAAQRETLNAEHAKSVADADWSKAAQRFPDYNEVVRAEVQISKAMEAVMRMDPETGTALAYYLGQHPEESERIAKASLANNEREWTNALARAGMELGTIRAKLASEATAPKAAAPKTAEPIPVAPLKPKTVTSASKPPTQLRAGAAAPAVDTMSDEDARDYNKWVKARDAELARAGKR